MASLLQLGDGWGPGNPDSRAVSDCGPYLPCWAEESGQKGLRQKRKERGRWGGGCQTTSQSGALLTRGLSFLTPKFRAEGPATLGFCVPRVSRVCPFLLGMGNAVSISPLPQFRLLHWSRRKRDSGGGLVGGAQHPGVPAGGGPSSPSAAPLPRP